MKKTDFDFEYFDTTADIGIDIKSDNMNHAYINAGLATLNLITDIDKIKPVTTRDVILESEDEYGLLYDWITELLILLDSENFIASEYNINIEPAEQGYILKGTISGDIYNTDKYNYKTEVKAITYHKMEISQENDLYHVRFIVDL